MCNNFIFAFFSKKFKFKDLVFFYKSIFPAQLLAFSTSSSAATLPLTFERVEQHLKVRPRVAGFVLPLGATINMDGTSLYQGIAAVFIAQAFGLDLMKTKYNFSCPFSALLPLLITADNADLTLLEKSGCRRACRTLNV